MSFDPMAELPLLTADLPGIGGCIKVQPEDFEVEEIPAYEPSGSGEYLYLWIEKRAMGAEYFVRQVARRLGVNPGDVGTAGLKDRHAVTRQMVSVPASAADRLGQLEGEGIRLLRVSRHGNKLRPGHLRGNRFRILIRDVVPQAGERLGPLLDRLRRDGLPNFYGPQRFGRGGETVRAGFALLRGESPPVSASGRPFDLRNRFLRKLALSAAQSALFNHYLARRMADGLLRRVLTGDVMTKWPVGGLFVAADREREQARFDARETVHTGPVFGRKTLAAAGEAAAREADTLREAGLDAGVWGRFGKLAQGTRRHNLVYVDDLAATVEPEGVRLTFTLPAGSYATVLLREITRTTAEVEE
ncbi:MAG TPA: tRNA pseudouridine(13) synthase TruD [Gemmataceae bacterium]|nr:tRNA pseudouridine(13) synthase TruD [Gemmataceae bacterium]